jgi:carbonic anhydrase/acetyltransferase-like protein (isoleucine patch superfamily)
MNETYKGQTPDIDESAWVHDNAVLIGDVTIKAKANVWPGCVLRGDQGSIVVGAETSIQDGTIAHCTGGMSTTVVGDRCTVGHRVVLHGCIVEDDCLIGMGAILLDNCEIGTGSIIGAGALIPVGKKIPPRSKVMGIPGKIVGEVSDWEYQMMIGGGHHEYQKLLADYRGESSGE